MGAAAVRDGELMLEGAEEEAAAVSATPDPPAAPNWSAELLDWMLNEKAELLVETQRAQHRQQKLATELDRLQARGTGADQEVQRLLFEPVLRKFAQAQERSKKREFLDLFSKRANV